MKKKVFSYLALGFVTLSGMVATAISTFSWFVASVVTPEYKLSGSSAGAYFAYGDGSVDHPFGISIPRHLYNLSWLQYMGQFSDKQYYFELADSVPEAGLNMSGYIIPPIGTEDNPFISNFDGNGKIIKNLTVTNDETTIFSSARHPDPTSVDYKAPEIIGFFGVVGEITSSASSSSTTNSIHDFTLESVNIDSTTGKTLIGLVAGYVNGDMNEVKVTGASTLNVNGQTAVDTSITKRLSEYGLVGYSANLASKGTYSQSISKYYDSTLDQSSGSGDDFGGSINMDKILKRLVAMRKSSTTTIPLRETIDYYDGEPQTPTNVTNQTIYNVKDDYANGLYGNVIYAKYDNDNSGNNNEKKYYLTGGHFETRAYHTYYQHSGIKIVSGTTHSLTFTGTFGNNQTVNQDTTPENSIVWQEEGTTNVKLLTKYNDTSYYLQTYNNGLRLVTSASNGTTFTKETDDNGKIRYSSNGYYIGYDSSDSHWKMLQIPVYPTEPNLTNPETIKPTEPNLPRPETIMPSGTRPEEPQTYGYQITYTNNDITYFLVPGTTGVEMSRTPYDGGWTYYTDGSYYYLRTNYSGTKYLAASTRALSLSTSTGRSRRITRTANSSGDYSYNFTNASRYLTLSSSNATVSTTQNYYPFSNDWTVYNNTVMTLTDALEQYDDDIALWADYDQAKEAWDQYDEDFAIYEAAKEDWDLAWGQYYDDLETYPDRLAATYSLSTITVTAENPVIGPDNHQTAQDIANGTADSRMYYSPEDTTYFPINVYEADEYNDGNQLVGKKYEPTLKNTGYFVAGTTTTSWSTSSSSSPRSVAIAAYPVNYIQNSFTDTYQSGYTFEKMNKVYTIDNTNNSQPYIFANNRFVQYGDDEDLGGTKELFYNNMIKGKKGTDYVAGLHFVTQSNSSYGLINTNAILRSKNVSVLGNNYIEDDNPETDNTYDLPVYSIDFSVKRKGYIKFFAGAYNGGINTSSNGSMSSTTTSANCFFTFHKVYRDESKQRITNIREIKGIYEDPLSLTNTFVYSYKDSSGNEVSESGAAFDSTGLNLLFDSNWIGENSAIKNKPGVIYYFEIPVDGGEYCLGNVKNGDGCYLMYLDIGAAGTDAADIVHAYSITTNSTSILYPTGIDFGVTGVTGEGGESICIYIKAGKVGSITFTLNNDLDDIEITDVNEISTYSYKSSTFGDTYTVSGNSPGELDEIPPGGTRVSYIKVWQTNAINYDATITDTLDENGNVLTTVCTLDGQEITLEDLQDTVTALYTTRIANIRDLENAVTLEVRNGRTFEISLPDMAWDYEDRYDISLELATGVRVSVTIVGEYTVYINETSVVNGGTYPATP